MPIHEQIQERYGQRLPELCAAGIAMAYCIECVVREGTWFGNRYQPKGQRKHSVSVVFGEEDITLCLTGITHPENQFQALEAVHCSNRSGPWGSYHCCECKVRGNAQLTDAQEFIKFVLGNFQGRNTRPH